MAECNGICMTPADIGLPEYSYVEVAYAHPDCLAHGDPQEEYPELDICDAGGYENLRYVREGDIADG